MYRVLFICTGNICRSPTAEGVFRDRVSAAGLSQLIDTDSAGIGSWHIGSPPDARAISAARRRRVDLSELRARQINPEDVDKFDMMLAMDSGHRTSLMQYFGEVGAAKTRLLMEFADDPDGYEIPDPYYSGDAEFEVVLDMIGPACDGLLRHIKQELT